MKKDKIKVLQVVGSLHIGGAENVAANLFRYIDRDRYIFDYVVYTDEEGEYEREIKDLGGNVLRIKGPGKNRIDFYKRMNELILKHGPYDIVHSHMMFHNGTIMKLAKKNGIIIRISHSHSTKNTIRTNYVMKFLDLIYRQYERKIILKNANQFWACGEKAGCFLYGRNFFNKNGFIINNGIDLKKYGYNEELRKIIREDNDWNGKAVFGLAAHFQKVKNHKFLINVFDEYHKIRPESMLVLMGDGKTREEIFNLVKKKNIEKNVVFMGNIDNVFDFYQGIDMVLMPSLFEGIPVSLIEAQSAGLRCIVSDRVSRDVGYTDLITFCSIDEGEKIWVDNMLQQIDYDRCSKQDELEQLGLDVRACVKDVQSRYEKLLEAVQN